MNALRRLIGSHTYHYLTLLLLALTCSVAQAHESSTAYLNLNLSDSESTAESKYDTEYELSLRDLALLIDIDPNKDSQVSWAEVKSQTSLIEQLIQSKIKLESNAQACQITKFAPLAINTRGGFNYLYSNFALSCAQPIDNLDYQILAGIDANHRLFYSG